MGVEPMSKAAPRIQFRYDSDEQIERLECNDGVLLEITRGVAGQSLDGLPDDISKGVDAAQIKLRKLESISRIRGCLLNQDCGSYEPVFLEKLCVLLKNVSDPIVVSSIFSALNLMLSKSALDSILPVLLAKVFTNTRDFSVADTEIHTPYGFFRRCIEFDAMHTLNTCVKILPRRKNVKVLSFLQVLECVFKTDDWAKHSVVALCIRLLADDIGHRHSPRVDINRLAIEGIDLLSGKLAGNSEFSDTVVQLVEVRGFKGTNAYQKQSKSMQDIAGKLDDSAGQGSQSRKRKEVDDVKCLPSPTSRGPLRRRFKAGELSLSGFAPESEFGTKPDTQGESHFVVGASLCKTKKQSSRSGSGGLDNAVKEPLQLGSLDAKSPAASPKWNPKEPDQGSAGANFSLMSSVVSDILSGAMDSANCGKKHS